MCCVCEREIYGVIRFATGFWFLDSFFCLFFFFFGIGIGLSGFRKFFW